MGFGAPLPFDLPTAVSQVTNGDGDGPGGFSDDVELANAAYGQAETFVTPLQMALVAATVANDGELMRPHLVTAIDRQGRDADDRARVDAAGSSRRPTPRRSRPRWSRRSRATLGRQFTAGAKVPGVTDRRQVRHGRARRHGEPHSWFIGFAPAEDPQVAIAVLVEQAGAAARSAAPIAGDLMTLYLEPWP